MNHVSHLVSDNTQDQLVRLRIKGLQYNDRALLPVPNEGLLHKTLEHIESLQHDPDSTIVWQQDHWAEKIVNKKGDFCGTSFCFAGWAAHLIGAPVVNLSHEADKLTPVEKLDTFINSVHVLSPEDEVPEVDDEGWWLSSSPSLVPEGMRMESIPSAAARNLGLTHAESSALFSGDNKLHHLREIVEAIVANYHRQNPVEGTL